MRTAWGAAWLSAMLLGIAGMAMSAEKGSGKAAEPMRVTVGTELYLDQEGRVSDLRFDEGTQPAIAALVRGTVERWRFEPILRDGKPVPARTGMSLDLTGTPVDGGFRMRVEKVAFVSSRAKPERFVVPSMPIEAMSHGLDIAVLAAMRVNAEGKVTDVAVLAMTFSDNGRNTRLRRTMQAELERALRLSKFRPADIAHGEAAEDTFYLPINYLAERGNKAPEERERWRDAAPVPWLDAGHQPKLIDLPESKGMPVALVNADVKLRDDVVGKSL